MLLAIITSLFIAVQDPVIQKFAVRFVGGYFSEKTGADVKIGRLVVTPDFNILIEDVSVKDLKGNDLVILERLRAKVFVGELLEGNFHLGRVFLRNAEFNLVKYEGEDGFNIVALIKAFGTPEKKEKDPNKEPFSILIDDVLINNFNFVLWNQDRDKPDWIEKKAMDYAHLDLDSIYLAAKKFQIVGDSVHAAIELLKGKESSGIVIKTMQTDATVCQSGIFLQDLQMETNNSLLHLDLNMLYHGYPSFLKFVDSVVFDATIYPTDLMLSDIGVFAPVMYTMPDRIFFEARFTGPISHFTVSDMDAQLGESSSLQGSISMHPLDFNNGEHTMDIKKFQFTYDDIVNFYIPGKTVTVPFPESLRAINSGTARLNFKGSYNDFDSEIHLLSNVGKVDVNVSRDKKTNGDNVFLGDISAEHVDAGLLANAKKVVGELDLDAEFEAVFPKNGAVNLTVNGKAANAQLLGNRIDEVMLNGDMKDNRFLGKVNIDDDELVLDFDGLIDFKDKKYPKADFAAVIRHADLRALNLIGNDSVSKVSTRVAVNLTGFNIDDLEGELHLDSTVYCNSKGEYFMQDFDASIVNDNMMQRRIEITNDFFDFEMAGKMNFASMMMVLDEYGDSFVHFPIWEDNREKFQKYQKKHDVEQDFVFSLNLKDAKTLCRLFVPDLSIAKNTTVNGTFTSRSRQLNLKARSKSVKIGDVTVDNIQLKNFNTRNAIFSLLSIGGVSFTNITATDTLTYGLDNLLLSAKMANDTIATSIQWDDASNDDHNKAMIETAFHPHEEGGVISIGKGNIRINDSLWEVSPSNFIDIIDGRVTLSNIMFSHNRQSLRLDGYVPLAAQDTLDVQLRNFDISNLDVLIQRLGIDLDGFISGDAFISNLNESPMVLADLSIDSLGLNGDYIGETDVMTSWDNTHKAVDMNATINNGSRQTLSVDGTYFMARQTDNLDFYITMDSLQLNLLSPFLTGVVSRMQGFGHGAVSVTGTIEKPDVKGQLRIEKGGCEVNYLRTFYTFNPTIQIDSRTIELKDLVLVDTLGNKARVEGKIQHDHFKNFQLDLKLHPRDFLAMATTFHDNETFYGNVFANGLVSVNGPVNDIDLKINARTRKGTKFMLPLNTTSRISDNDFVVFVEKKPETEEEVETATEIVKNKLTIGIDVDVTDDASIRINLPGDIGTIDASGNGNIKVGSATKEALTLFGNYVISQGRFQLNLKNILTRTFTLKPGGTISWTGVPTEGRIDVTGAYTVKPSLSTLGVAVDSTSSSGNVSVECLIHLKDALLNPTITFGMNLPNASDELAQSVYALIDTTDQAVMTTQALSLLLLGSFSSAGGSGGGSTNYLDALTNLYGGLNLDVTENLNIGLRYLGGNSNSYDEYQINMKSEFFQNRLLIETNFGVISNNGSNSGNASNIVGEFDMYYKLSKDGRLRAHFYNHSNYNTNYSSFSFDRLAPYTQGLGLSYGRSFDRFSDIFKRKKNTFSTAPMINRQNTGQQP